MLYILLKYQSIKITKLEFLISIFYIQ